MRGEVISRPRVNQPTGYRPSLHHNIRPITHYCVHHNYVYYPYDWTDESSGRTYKTGYYDENGEYYQDVVFRTNGTYKNVICKCEYCDTVSKIDWTEGGPLICAQCGGTMKIVSMLDEYTRDPNYDSLCQRRDYVDYADADSCRGDYGDPSYGGYDDTPSRNTGKYKLIFYALLALFLLLPSIHLNSRSSGSSYDYNVVVWNGSPEQEPSYAESFSSPSNPELFGTVISLKELSPGVYTITEAGDGSRTLVWDEAEQSYFDESSGLWAWYNTDLWPELWQYWYEPISGDYGDYGWMEYENGVWYIEAKSGSWIPVPEQYDTSALWHIASEFESELPTQTNPELFGTEIALEELAPGCFRISEWDASDKTLVWDEEEQSYYDESSGLWAWYNTNVEPPLWQYWYEPISGDYEYYGWMEYEDGVWYIEIGDGAWIDLPPQYDSSGLWHIEMTE